MIHKLGFQDLLHVQSWGHLLRTIESFLVHYRLYDILNKSLHCYKFFLHIICLLLIIFTLSYHQLNPYLIFPSRNLSESQTNLYTLHTAAARLRFSRALLFLLGKAPK